MEQELNKFGVLLWSTHSYFPGASRGLSWVTLNYLLGISGSQKNPSGMHEEYRPLWQGRDRRSLWEGARSPATEVRVETMAELGRGPCFSCSQMGHYWRYCPFMECNLTSSPTHMERQQAPCACWWLVARWWTWWLRSFGGLASWWLWWTQEALSTQVHGLHDLLPSAPHWPARPEMDDCYMPAPALTMPASGLNLVELSGDSPSSRGQARGRPTKSRVVGMWCPGLPAFVEGADRSQTAVSPANWGQPGWGHSNCLLTGGDSNPANQLTGGDAPPTLLPDVAFHQAQEKDTSLDHLRGEVALVNGQGRDPRWALRYPHIEKDGGI